ncbi:MAG: TetR/AcrR family transcriptional regulator [Desulfovibrionaceae bacterium]|nr:TetR/AcrR family transcriptional regulator [Desulfovibrionaceae bacterium]
MVLRKQIAQDCTTNKDLRVQKTLQSIEQAFYQLLLEKELAKITVTELCKRAQILRKTFYSHYDSIEQLLQEKLEILMQDYLQRISNYEVPKQVAEICESFYAFVTEQGPLAERIFCASVFQETGNKILRELVARTWQDAAWFQALSRTEQTLLLTFVYSAGAGLYRQWVENGKQIPVQQMSKYANILLSQGIWGIMQEKLKP